MKDFQEKTDNKEKEIANEMSRKWNSIDEIKFSSLWKRKYKKSSRNLQKTQKYKSENVSIIIYKLKLIWNKNIH